MDDDVDEHLATALHDLPGASHSCDLEGGEIEDLLSCQLDGSHDDDCQDWSMERGWNDDPLLEVASAGGLVSDGRGDRGDMDEPPSKVLRLDDSELTRTQDGSRDSTPNSGTLEFSMQSEGLGIGM